MATDTLRLDGIELNPNMEWVDRHTSQGVAQASIRTLGGKLVTYSQTLDKGQSIILEATEDYGWLQLPVVTALSALANIVGATYTLEMGDTEIYLVMFNHENAPALDMRAFIPRVTEGNNDYFKGKIKLITV